MNEVASLTMRVQSLEVETANNRLKDLKKSGKEAEGATSGLTNSFKSLLGPLLASVSALSALNKLTDTARQFDVLNAQLITATGSAENASVAFEALQDFAKNTPYDLAQAVEGFTKLVNLGLTPSEKALTSYGNTAAAMGKDLGQMVQAVANATTGELEMLKSFGIKAKVEGDKISFIFRGTKTTVQNNAQEIEKYMMALGENEFAGAMQQRMNSLDGAVSNLADSWDQLFLNVSNAGVGDFIEEQVRTATAALDELNNMIKSGEAEAYLEGFMMKFDAWGQDFEHTSQEAMKAWMATMEFLGITSEDVTKLIADNFDTNLSHIPENIRALIQLAAVEIAAIADYGKAAGIQFGEYLGVELGQIVETSKAYGTAIGQALNPFDDDSFDLEGKLTELDKVAEEMHQGSLKRAQDSVEASRQARMESIEAILAERDASIKSSEEQFDAAKKLREEYDRLSAERDADKSDRLAGFSQAPTGVAAVQTDDEKKAESKRKKEFEKVQESLRTEEQTILDSYKKRREIILQNTQANSEAQASLLKSLNEKFATDVMGDWENPDTHEEEMKALQDRFEARRAIILENTAITEEERTKLEEELTRNRDEKLAAIEAQRRSVVLSGAADLFDSLAGIAEQFSGRQSGIFKALFAVSKAFALADSIVKIQQGLANAASLPFPANVGAMATVASATAGVLSTIKSTKVEGIAHGGLDYVPEESTYRLAKGERVLSPKQNKDFTEKMKSMDTGKESGVNVNIEVINNMAGQAEVNVQRDDEGRIKFIIDAAKSSIRQDIQEGRGIGRDIQQKYGLGTRSAI